MKSREREMKMLPLEIRTWRPPKKSSRKETSRRCNRRRMRKLRFRSKRSIKFPSRRTLEDKSLLKVRDETFISSFIIKLKLLSDLLLK